MIPMTKIKPTVLAYYFPNWHVDPRNEEWHGKGWTEWEVLKHAVILAIISAVAALISMVGDLTASAIKRNYEIKDYGTLIPGHGGIMDRFDSMMITAPIIYYLAVNFL